MPPLISGKCIQKKLKYLDFLKSVIHFPSSILKDRSKMMFIILSALVLGHLLIFLQVHFLVREVSFVINACHVYSHLVEL